MVVVRSRPSGLRITKEGEDVNSPRSRGRHRSPRSAGHTFTSKTHRHAMEENIVNRDEGTICGFRCSHPVRTKNTTILRTWLQQPDGTFNASDVPRQLVFDAWFRMFQSLPCHLCLCFTIFSNLRLLLECHANWLHLPHAMNTERFAWSSESSRMLASTLHSRRPSPWRGVPLSQEKSCQSFPAGKAAVRTGIQSTNAMECGLHVCGTPCRPILGTKR